MTTTRLRCNHHHLIPTSSPLVTKKIEALYKPNVDALVRKSSLPIFGFQPSSKMQIRKVLDTNEKVIKRKGHDGLLTNKPTEVDSFDLDKAVVSYEPNMDTTSVSHKFDLKNSIAMETALRIQENLPSKLPSFVKTMLLSHVASGFTMSLPKNFTDLHLPKHDETVVLVDENELEYRTKYLTGKSGLSAGWRGFSIAHKLKEKDVLVFHLIQQCKFKVYIVRANAASTDIDRTNDFLNLDACVGEMDKDRQEKDLKITEMSREKHWEPYSKGNGAADHFDMDTDIYGSENFEGIRFSQSVVDFKDVKSFEHFNIHVNGMIIDCEIPQHLRVKYFELCCSQKSYLHDQLIEGLNLQLVVGFIFETINIADAISSSKFSTCCKNLQIWDKTLKAFEDMGMKVGFLRARINKLLSLSSNSEEDLKCKRLEKEKAEGEVKALERKLITAKKAIEKLDYEIEVMEMKGERLEAVFMEEAKAPW